METVSVPSPDPVVVVVVDDREREAGVLAALRQFPEVQVRIGRLKCGDYEVDGSCVFERKTLLDFAASIVDGRLFRQGWRLAKSCPLAALILEGRARDLENCPVRREAMQGALVSLSLIYRLPVLRSVDPAETARLLLYAGRQLRRSQAADALRSGYRPKTRRRRQLRVLHALPGVGSDRAASLLDAFGSVQAVMSADEAALQAVAGIGVRTAAAIREVLG
jgi:DNA excision repair protein ERCC-4